MSTALGSLSCAGDGARGGGGVMSEPRMQVSRVPSKPVRRDEDGTLTIDLWLRTGGEFASDLALRLTAAEAEALHVQLCYALVDATASVITPCPAARLPVRVTCHATGCIPASALLA
jgi:hypothetical protein